MFLDGGFGRLHGRHSASRPIFRFRVPYWSTAAELVGDSPTGVAWLPPTIFRIGGYSSTRPGCPLAGGAPIDIPWINGLVPWFELRFVTPSRSCSRGARGRWAELARCHVPHAILASDALFYAAMAFLLFNRVSVPPPNKALQLTGVQGRLQHGFTGYTGQIGAVGGRPWHPGS